MADTFRGFNEPTTPTEVQGREGGEARSLAVDASGRARLAEGDVVGALLVEQRLTNLLLAHAFGIKDNLDGLRKDLMGGGDTMLN